MSFAGKVWRLLVGIKDALVLLLLLLFFSALFAALSFRPSAAPVREGALLLDLGGFVVEEPAVLDPMEVLLSGTLPVREFAARDLIAAIDGAAGDERIEAVALDLTAFLGGGQVSLSEIGAALDRFRAAGKPVFAYSIAYSDDAMLLAAHASEVWVDPMGATFLRGPGGAQLYYADLLDRFGITAHVYRVGTYKSAVEPYLRDSMSPEARENYETIYSSLWEEWRADVTQARSKANIQRATQDLPALIAEANGDLARAAMAAGLADRIGTRIEWGERIAEEVGEDLLDDAPGTFAMTEYDPWLAEIGPPGSGGPAFVGTGRAIGVVTVAGTIVDGDAGPGTAGADRIAALLDDARNADLAALVVRIDSPGGTVTGSETIRRAILRHKANKIPIVVSMGNVAASGGYWVATTGDRIFAEPETLTGSIGVFAVIPSFEDLLTEYGVNSDGVRTTPLSGQPDILSGFTPEADLMLQAGVEGSYARFLDLVASSRSVSRQRADELGQGRVWTGGAARQLGLVDQFGDLDAAIEWAAAQAKLKEGEWHPRYLQSESAALPAMLAQFLGVGAEAPAQGHDAVAHFARGEQQLTARILADLSGMLAAPGVQARCLACVTALPARPATDLPAAHASSLLRSLLRPLILAR